MKYLIIGFVISTIVLIFLQKFDVFRLNHDFQIITEAGQAIPAYLYKEVSYFKNDTSKEIIVKFFESYAKYSPLKINVKDKHSNVISCVKTEDNFGFLFIPNWKIRLKSDASLYGYSETEFKKDTIKLLIRTHSSFERIFMVKGDLLD